MRKYFWIGLAAILLTGASEGLFAESPAKTADSGESAVSQAETLDFCSPAVFNSLVAFLADGAAKEDVFRLTDDGIIEVNGSHIGYLATPASYRNFTLSGEYSLQNAETNGGLLARVTRATPTFLPRCVEIQVMSGLTGDLFGFHDLVIHGEAERTVTGKDHAMVGNYCQLNALRGAERPIPEWNRIEVTCFEDFVLVRVNGRIVNWANGVEKADAPAAIQSEGGKLRWRNLRLTPEQ